MFPPIFTKDDKLRITLLSGAVLIKEPPISVRFANPSEFVRDDELIWTLPPIFVNCDKLSKLAILVPVKPTLPLIIEHPG